MSNFNLQDNFPLLRFDQPWSVEKFASKDDLAKQVTFDELLLEKVGSGEIGPCLYINSTPRCLVATVRESRMSNFEAAQQVLAAQGWPVVVRCTGGSCVPQGPGVINLAVIHPKVKGWHLEDGYQLLCVLLRELLAEYGLDATTGEVPGSFCDGNYNLQVGGQKLVGTAQRWAGGSRNSAAVLAHACLLVDLDLVEATEKINNLYSLCDNPQQFLPQACTSLRDCLGPRTSQTTEAFVSEVDQRLLKMTKEFFNISG
jgi:octanoyl-[GcvH]:protein N-octanoyltransferase